MTFKPVNICLFFLNIGLQSTLKLTYNINIINSKGKLKHVALAIQMLVL